MDVIEGIDRILQDRNIVSHDISGFDEAEQREFYCFDLVAGGRRMWIDVCRECTVYFEDWHGHYDPETEWDELLQTLDGILDNELCSLGTSVGGAGLQSSGSAMLARSEDVSEEYVIDEFGTGKVVRCRFFDPSLNREYRV